MKVSGTNLVQFPKLRRAEQDGLTQRSFPIRWLGLLLMTTVGGAWALNPVAEKPLDSKMYEARLSGPVFVGEPQVVAQLMGATVGAEATPQRQLKPIGAKQRRVVVSAGTQAPSAEPQDDPAFIRMVEQIEGEYAASGSYPALPADSVDSKEIGYQVEQDHFRLNGPSISYDSERGFTRTAPKEEKGTSYQVVGELKDVVKGWGPWKTPACQFDSPNGKVQKELSWLASATETPSWSARMYFPVSREQTGYAFRRADGTSIYSSGELLFDGVNGTFRLKLNRAQKAEAFELSPKALESELACDDAACSLVGETQLLQDLGFLAGHAKPGAVAHVSSPVRQKLEAGDALAGRHLATFTRHARELDSTAFAARQGEEGKATVVGRMELVDKLGQIHNVRVRAGRAEQYDWVVGQLCEVPEEDPKLYLSQGYDDAFRRQTPHLITAGK